MTWNRQIVTFLACFIFSPFSFANTIPKQYDQTVNAEYILGDIPKAIQLYQSVVDDLKKEDTLFNYAKLRLATCHWKLQKHYDAIVTLDSITYSGNDATLTEGIKDLRPYQS